MPGPRSPGWETNSISPSRFPANGLCASERLVLPGRTFNPLGVFARPQPESGEIPWTADEGGGSVGPAT